MRLAPVPLYFASDPREAIGKAGESSRTTHGARAAVDSCRYFAGLLLGALPGEAKERLLEELFCPIPGFWQQNRLDPAVEAVAAGSFKRKEPPALGGHRVRGGLPGVSPVGLSPRRQLRGRLPAGREPGRRCGHHGRGVRSAGRRLLRPASTGAGDYLPGGEALPAHLSRGSFLFQSLPACPKRSRRSPCSAESAHKLTVDVFVRSERQAQAISPVLPVLPHQI
jgi:hypothetical protein